MRTFPLLKSQNQEHPDANLLIFLSFFRGSNSHLPQWIFLPVVHSGSTSEGEEKEVFLRVSLLACFCEVGGKTEYFYEFLKFNFSSGAPISFLLKELSSGGFCVEWRSVGISCVSFCNSSIRPLFSMNFKLRPNDGYLGSLPFLFLSPLFEETAVQLRL